MKWNKLLRIPTIVCILLLLGALMIKYVYQDIGYKPEYKNPFIPVRITGEYNIDGGPWMKLTEDTLFEVDGHHTFRIRGNFEKDIEKKHLIMLRITD